MKVAITGANGYLGEALCKYLYERDNTVIAITRSKFVQKEYRNVVVESLSSADLSPQIQNLDCLIHLAARTHHSEPDSAGVLALYRKDNVQVSVNLAQMAISAGVKRFIYVSSIKVNGEESIQPFRSDDAPSPVDAYGISKWETENKLKELLEPSTVELVIIRPPLIWGGKPKGNLNILMKLIEKGIPLPFKNIQNRRDIVSLSNICSLIETAANHRDAPGQTFLVSDGISRSTAQIVQLLERSTTKKIKLISIPQCLFTMAQLIPSCKPHIRKLIGNLEIDISETYQKLGWLPTIQQ